MFVNYHHVVIFVVGVYAWIGINFVLGRFDHVHNGECPSNSLMSVWPFKAYVSLYYLSVCSL